jgi:alkylation response protein AidB-like acyl-CoA dehydrogenase
VTDFSELHDDLRSVARDLLASGSMAWADLAQLGWLGLEVPGELGGAGATFAETAVVLEELGRAASATAYLGTAVLGVGALGAVASDPGRDRLLAAVAGGERRIAVALCRHGDQAVVDAPFRLLRTASEMRVTGEAAFVVDAGDADDLLLLATDADESLVLVHAPASDLAITDEPVVDATRRFASVASDGVVVPPSSVWLLDGSAVAGAQQVLDRGAVAVAIDSLGIAAAMLDATVAYVSDRHQFGRPVGSFQAVKHQCADMLVGLTVGRELVAQAVGAVADPGADPTAAVARAASYASELGVAVAGTAMQLHGGFGYTWESGIHVFLKRATLNRSLFGSPAAQRRRLAEGITAALSGAQGAE